MRWREAAQGDEAVPVFFCVSLRLSLPAPPAADRGGLKRNAVEAPALYTGLFLAPREPN